MSLKMDKRQKVVIIGHGYTSRLCVIRSVAQIGCDIIVIAIVGKKKDGTLYTCKPIDCYSKYVSCVMYCERDADLLTKMLLERCVDQSQKVVLFPDSDFSAAVIDSNQEKLKDHFLFPHINCEQGAVVNWMNKEKQKEQAKAIGLNVTNSTSVEIIGGKYLLPQDIHYPCFTKARSHIKSSKHVLKCCRKEKELCDFLTCIGHEYEQLTLLIEDYKEIEKEYAVLGFSDGKEVVIPGVIQILSMAHGTHFGVACRGKVMPIEGFEELVSRFKQLLLFIGYVGVFDIDFFYSGGKYYFGELNLRIGGSCYAITKMGVNLPAIMVKSLCGESVVNMSKEIKQSAFFVNERMCLDDWYFRYISTKEYHKIINSADISFVKDEDDAYPYIKFKKEYRKRQIMRIVKRMLFR